MNATDFDTYDRLWRVLYAIQGAQYARALLARDSNPDGTPPELEAADGLGVAIELLSSMGERIAAEARERKTGEHIAAEVHP